MEKQRFIFDIDGALLESDYSYEKEYFRSVLSSEDAKRFLPMIGRLVTKYEQKHMCYDISLLSKYLTYESGILISKEMINGWQQALSETTPIVMDGVVETLEDLKHRNKSLAIITRWFLKPQVIRLEKSNLKSYFDDFYGGDSFIKSDRQGYIDACGRYPMDECVMIGDSLEADIYGAMAIGLDAIYYNPSNKDDFDKSKVKSIGNMKELRRFY